MANVSNQAMSARIEELANRIEWLDGERRNASRRVAELEKELAVRDKQTQSMAKRLQNSEDKLKDFSSKLNRLSQGETQLELYREEMLKIIDQNDKRRLQSESEMEKLRRVERESQQRELAEMRKKLDAIKPLQYEIELRETEDARLSVLIGSLQSRSAELASDVDSNRLDINFLQETTAGNTRDNSELQTLIQTAISRLEALETRADVASDQIAKARAASQQMADSMDALRQSWKEVNDQVMMNDLQRSKRMESWQAAIEDNASAMDGYAKEWLKFSDQYKAAKMAAENMEAWAERIEKHQVEISELTRVEAERMRARLEAFTGENNKRLKNYEIDLEQHINALQRRDSQLAANVEELKSTSDELQIELETIWRIQSAQNEAIKKWPRIFSEEVEKSISQNPHSRRQPALVPVREE